MKTRGILLLTILSTITAYAGESSGGGGFAFMNSKAILRDSIKETTALLEHRDQDCVNRELAAMGAGPVDLERIKTIISKTRLNFLDERVRKNDEGVMEPLVLDYGTNESGPYIETLKLFFVGFMTYQENGPGSIGNRNLVNNLLLHEASHHFKYNDKQAEYFSTFLTTQKFDPPYHVYYPCGK